VLPSSEARSHGVGYFKFSKDEEQRQEQLSVLNKLRQQVCVHAHTPGLFVSTPIHLDYVCVHTHTPGLCLCPRPHTWTVCVHTHTPGLCLCPHPHTWTMSVSTPTHLDYVCVHTHTPGLCLCPRPHTWTVFCVGFNCSTCVYVCGAIDWQPEEAKRGDQREEKGIAGNKTS
jgi:hypothetical protein